MGRDGFPKRYAAELGPKNQVTVPEAIVEALGLEVGDRMMFVVEDGQRHPLAVFPLPRSLAGIAPDAYGGATTSSAEYVQGEREGWEG